MAILRGAAKNVFNLLRRREHPVRVQDSDHHPDDPVLSPTLVHTLTGVYLFVSFLPDSQHFIGGCCDGTVRKWQVTDGREVGKVMNHGSLVTAIAMSEDGKAIASGGVDGKVVIWSTDTCENLVESPEEHSDWVTSLSFAPNLQTVASGSRDGSIIVWSATTGKRVTGPLGGSKDSVDFLSFSPAGDKIASCGYFGDVQIWDSSLGERILKIPALASVCWSHDGSQFICGSFNGTIEFFDSSSGAHLATCRGHEHLVTSIAVSQDGTWLASASFDDHTVRLWSTSTHQQLASLDHSGQVFGVSISPNDTYIASGGYNKINIWRLPNVNATLQKGKGDPAASRPVASSSQSAAVNKDDPSWTASTEDATQARENGHNHRQDLASVQSNHATRRVSLESWMDMPAVLPPGVPADDGIYAHFFDEPLTLQSERNDDCPPREEKNKAKETRQRVFQQLKDLCDTMLPRDRPSDNSSHPRPFSSHKLKDRIRRIRRRTSLVRKNAEYPAETEAPSSKQILGKTWKPKPSLVLYSRLRSTLAVASNDPPVEQKKYYYARRNGRLVPIDPPVQSTTGSQHQRRRRNPFSMTSRSTASAHGQSSSTTPTITSLQGQAQGTGQQASGDFEVECACCGFSILARSL